MEQAAKAGLWMRSHDQGRPALPSHLTPAEREFFVALRRLVDASPVSLGELAAVTSSPGPEPDESSLVTEYTALQWQDWLNGQSLPPRKAVRKLAEALARADIDAGSLIEQWALAFMPTPYPQEPGGAAARAVRLPAAAPDLTGEPPDRDLHLRGSAELDAATRSAFADSYLRLSDSTARMLRLLSEHPGPDVSVSAAASLAAVPVGQARTALDELAGADLMEERLPGRFTGRDLLRAYAAEQAQASEPATELDSALERLLDHYLQTIGNAMSLAYQQSLSIRIPPPQPGVQPERFGSDQQARAWCHAELRVIQSLVAHAAERGLDAYGWQIPSVMAPFLARSDFPHDFLALQRIALAAARRLGDPLALGHSHYHLAHACALLGEVADSDAHLKEALQCFTTAGDQAGAARTLNGMAQLLVQQGEYHGALEREKEALRLRLAVGDRDAIAHSEETIGSIYSSLGDYDLALRHCHRALDLSRETGARLLAADALTTLGFVYLAIGDAKRAIAFYMEVLAIYQQARENSSIVTALTGLGDAQLAAGEGSAARASWQQAVALLRDVPDADDQPVRARLSRLRPPT